MSGNVLYASQSFTTRILELQDAESKAVLALINDHIQSPTHVLRHHWRLGDVVIWDNLGAQHYAEADFYPEQRRMVHCTRVGTRHLEGGVSGSSASCFAEF